LFENDVIDGFELEEPTNAAAKILPHAGSRRASMIGGRENAGRRGSNADSIMRVGGAQGSRISIDQVKGSLASRTYGLNEAPVTDPRLRNWMLKKIKLYPELAGQAPLFNALLPIGLPETRATRNVSGPLRTEALADFLVSFIKKEIFQCITKGFKGMALIVDDAQVWLQET
jgi:hypothetical protein